MMETIYIVEDYCNQNALLIFFGAMVYFHNGGSIGSRGSPLVLEQLDPLAIGPLSQNR